MDKNNIRNLMKKGIHQRNQTQKSPKNLPDSEYLRQDSRTGHFICLICDSVIKTEALWIVHCKSESHKNKLIQKNSEKKRNLEEPILPKQDVEEPPTKKSKLHNVLPSNFFDEGIEPSAPIVPEETTEKKLEDIPLVGYIDDSSEQTIKSSNSTSQTKIDPTHEDESEVFKDFTKLEEEELKNFETIEKEESKKRQSKLEDLKEKSLHLKELKQKMLEKKSTTNSNKRKESTSKKKEEEKEEDDFLDWRSKGN